MGVRQFVACSCQREAGRVSSIAVTTAYIRAIVSGGAGREVSDSGGIGRLGLCGLGVNDYARSGSFKGHRLALEVGYPVYQDLDGPQLETDWMLTGGWQYAF